MLKRLKTVALSLIAITLIISIFSCSDDVFGNNEPTYIKLSSTLMEFDTIQEVQGKNLQLEATITLKGGASSRDVKWEPPEDQSAFKVQSTAGGVLTFQIYKSGTYVISAHADYNGKHWKTAQCVITINDALTQLRIYDATHDNSFTGDTGSITLVKGSTVELSPIYTPSSTSQQAVLWSIDNADVATISAKPNNKAVLTAVNTGKATVTLMSQENTSIRRTLQVIVNDAGEGQTFGLRSVELSPAGTEIEVGKKKSFTATVIDGNSNEVVDGKVEFGLTNKGSFSLSNISARTIDVTALSGGEGMLTAKYEKNGETVYTEIPISVTGDVKSISPSSSYINMLPNETVDIKVSYLPEDTVQKGYEAQILNGTSAVSIDPRSDNDTIKVIAVEEGSADIKLVSRYNTDVSALFHINVKKAATKEDRVRNVTISTNSVTLDPPFQPYTLTAKVFRREDSTNAIIEDPSFGVSWAVSNTEILSLKEDGNKAVIEAISPGTAIVTATSTDNSKVSASCIVTITGALRGLIPSINSVSIAKGDTVKVDLNSSPAVAIYDTPTVQVSNNNVSVSLEAIEGGHRASITGTRTGDSTVSYYVGTKKMAETKVSVYQQIPTTMRSIELSTTSMYLKQDADRVDGYLTAYAVDKYGGELSDRIEYKPGSETSEQIAAIERFDDHTFYVIPLNAGFADYYFYREGIDGVMTRLHIEVGGSAIQGETLRNIRMPYDSITMKKGTEEDITLTTIPLGLDPGSVTWTTTDASIVKVEGSTATAVLKAIGEGEATIKAETDNGLKATLLVKIFSESESADTTITSATISDSSSTDRYKIFTHEDRFNLTAKAFRADGTEVKGELFTWSIEGNAVEFLDSNTARAVASFHTTGIFPGYEAPTKITATSNSNPNVTATFLVYATSTQTVPKDNPIVYPEYTSITLEKGKSMEDGYFIHPTSYTTGNLVVTSSSSCATATINENAQKVEITGRSAGTATISVTDGKISFEIRVTVVEKSEKIDTGITSITLDRKYLSYDLSDKALQSITATVWRGKTQDTTAEVVWESLDTDIVKVSASGAIASVLPQKKTGSTFIQARAKDNSSVMASCLVEVIDSTQIGEKLRYIMLSESNVRLEPNATLTLRVSGQPSYLLANTRLVWESSNQQIATVSNGTVTALKEGETDITVKAMDGDNVLLSDTCHVTVKGIESVVRVPASIKLSESLLSVSQEDMDKSFTITATICDENGDYIPGRSVLWKVKDAAGAIEYSTSNLHFTFSPRSAGTVVVEASIGTVSAEAKIIVGGTKQLTEELKNVIVWPSKITTEINKEIVLNASTIPATDTTSILWSSDSTSVTLTGKERTATFSAKVPGTYTVTAYSSEHPEIKGTAIVEVKAQGEVKDDVITGIVLDKRNIVLDLADKALTAITATVYTNGKPNPSKDIEWEVSEDLENAIDWSKSGKNTLILTKKAVGEGYITAKSKDDNSYAAVCLVQVIDTTAEQKEELIAAMISSRSLSLETGSTYQFTLHLLPSDLEGTSITWSSSDESVAKIDNTGLMKAIKSGRSTITATVQNGDTILTQSCSVTVYSPTDEITPSRIVFNKTVVNLNQEKMDTTEEVTATVYGSDGSILDGEVSWSIDDAEIAKLNWSGNTALLSPLSAGTTKVRAQYRGLENSFMVITGATKPASATKATGIVFNPGALVLKKGTSATITAYTVPIGTDSKVAFSISNPSVVKAEYSQNIVKITGLSSGTAKLKAVLTDNSSISAEMDITVTDTTEGKVTAITLDKTFISLELDTKDLTQITASTYVNGVLSRTEPVEWTLEDITDTELTVTPSGTYGTTVNLLKKAKGAGWLVCTAKNNPEVYAKCRVEIVEPTAVENLTLERIQLSDSNITLRKSEAYTPTATLIPSGVNATITWTSDNSDIARVSSNGTITGVSKGSTTITAHAYDYEKEASIDVEVIEAPIANAVPSFIRLSTQEINLSQRTPDAEVPVTATVIATDGYAISGANVTWTIDNSRIAETTIDDNTITLKAGDAGKTTLRAWYGNLSTSATVYCSIKATTDLSLDHLTITPSVLTVKTGESGKAEVTGYPAGITITPEWTSEDTSKAVIETSTKTLSVVQVNAIKAGTTDIQVRDKGTDKSQKARVRVMDDITTAVTGIILDKSAIVFDLAEKSMARVTAQVYVNNTLSNTEPIEWTLLEEDLQTTSTLVSFVPAEATNRTIALKPGTEKGSAYLRATAPNDNEVYSQLYIEVIDSSQDPVVLKELKCEVDSAILSKGTTRTFKAFGYPTGAPVQVMWEVEKQIPTNKNENVITVDVNGKVTAVGEGTARLKAYDYKATNISDYIDITVTTKGSSSQTGGEPSEYDIGSISVTPANLRLSQETTFPQAIKATVYDTKGNQLSSESVVWDTSELKGVAVVDRTEGNTIYLLPSNAGSGKIKASRTSKDGTVITATAYIITGGTTVQDPEKLSAISFSSSMPVYLVAGDGKKVTTNLNYYPDKDSLKGVVWSGKNTAGYITYVTTDTSITAVGVQETPSNQNATVTATTINKDATDNALSETISYKVVATKADLPSVTSLVLDKTEVVLNLADKAAVAVTATGYDYDGNVIANAPVQWSLRNNTGTNVTITNTSGASTGINKGTSTGRVELVAKCGSVEAVCSITVTDTTYFEGISLSAETIRLVKGGEATIRVFGTPDSMFKFAECHKSGDTDAVEVVADGTQKIFSIQAKKAGTTFLEFTTEVDDKIYSAYAVVYVNDPETLTAQRMTLTPASLYIPTVGGTEELTARLWDRNGNEVSAPITYRAEDPSIAKVETKNGKTIVTGIKAGTTSIYAFGAELSAQSFVSVGSNPEESKTLIKIIPFMDSVTMKRNQKIDIDFTTVPSDWTLKNPRVVSSNTNVISASIVNGKIRLDAKSEGSAIVTLSEGSISTEISVTVSGNAIPSYIEFDQTGVTLEQSTGKNEATVKAFVYDQTRTLLNTPITLWQTSDASVAKIKSSSSGSGNTGASVTIQAVNSGSAMITAIAGDIKSTFRVSVSEIVSQATAPNKIKAGEANTTLTVSDTAELEVFFEPTGLSASAKSLKWKSSDEKIAKVTNLGNGKAMVTGIAVGRTSVIAESTAGVESEKPSTVFNIIVKAPSDTNNYRIELDVNKVRINTGDESIITAKLYENNVEIPADNISWSIESAEELGDLKFVSGQEHKTRVTGPSAIIYAGKKKGFAYVEASYGTGVVARAQVEIVDLNKANTGLTAVVISTRQLMMEEGEVALFEATTLPQNNGVKYKWGWTPDKADPGKIEWRSTSGGTATLRALQEGSGTISVEAELPGHQGVVYDTTELTIEGADTINQTFTYSKVVLDKTALSINPNGNYATITAKLLDKEGNEVSMPLSAWAALDSRGTEIFTWSKDGYVLTGKSDKYATFEALKEEAEKQNIALGFSSFSIIGSDATMVQVTPNRPGIWFVEARGPLENNKYVASRTMLDVSGEISAVSFGTQYLHMIIGETMDTTVSVAPNNASIKTFNWTEDVSVNEGESILEIVEKTEKSAKIRATKLGTTHVVYSVTDANGTTKNTTLIVTIHDPSYGTGGLREISFQEVYPVATYPYTSSMYRAFAKYMDETTAYDADIQYKVYNCDGSSATNSEVKSKDGTTVATFTVIQGSGVRITPFAKGTFRVQANLEHQGTVYTADMYLSIGGNTSTVTASSTNVVLYTGGSAKIGMTTDNTENDGNYRLTLIDEYTNTGYKIVDNKLEGTDIAMKSVFTTVREEKKGTDVVIGTKALPTEDQVVADYGLENMRPETTILPSGGTAEERLKNYNAILETFPRRATFLVENIDGTGSTEISVTVNQLPTGNTYPISLKLSSDKMDLTPPFTTEQTMTALLSDITGKSTVGTLNWYYYFIDGNPISSGSNANKLNTKANNDRDEIEAYFSPDTRTIYFKPKMSGLYRLTAESVQNPQLSYTSIVNVGGNVTGVIADIGSSLRIEKGTSSTITAKFTPTGALARKAWFAVEVSDGYYEIINGTSYNNDYIGVTVNSSKETGDTATVYGKTATGNDHRQIVRIIYPQSTTGESILRDDTHLGRDGGCFVKILGTTMRFYEKTDTGEPGAAIDNTVEVFSYATVVDVYASKTTYSFKVTGNTEIDPSIIPGTIFTYTVDASSTSSDKTFTDWDWIEAKLVGADTGMIYSSSVPVDASGHTLYLNEEEKTINTYSSAGKTGVLKMEAEKYYPDAKFCTPQTVGVAEKELSNYNSTKAVERYFEGIPSFEGAMEKPAKIVSDSDFSVFKFRDGTVVGGTSYEVLMGSNGKYIIKNGEQCTLDSLPSSAGFLALVEVPAPLSSFERGGLMISDNKKSYQISYDSNSIPTEPLVFKAGVSEYIENNNNAEGFYDEELEAFRTSDTPIYIGGKIQSIYSGGITCYNNNMNAGSNVISGGQVVLIEGASATIDLRYNPGYTHQKEVKWEVIGEPSMDTDEFSIEVSKDTTQATVFVKKLPADVNIKTVHLRATSLYNSSIKCDFSIILTCVVKNISFNSAALTQVNKGDRGALPQYKAITDKVNYPDQKSDNVIYCYDYSDVAGESALVDAYEVTMTPTPAFGYEFKAEIIEGKEIGELSTVGYDSKDNKFRFVPKGRIYNEYDSSGNGVASSGYDVTYGDVTIRISSDDLNYSRDFTIAYNAAGGRLVRAIPDGLDVFSAYPDYWDTSSVGSSEYISGLEAIVLYEGESFPVTMIDYNRGKGTTFRYGADATDSWSPTMRWSISDTNGNKSVVADTNPSDMSYLGVWIDGDGNSIPSSDLATPKGQRYAGGLTYTVSSINGGNTEDPRITASTPQETIEAYHAAGVYGEVCTLHAKRQGIYTLNYTLIDVGRYESGDKKGEIMYDTNGNVTYIITNGSIPVYVISKANQAMVAALDVLVADEIAVTIKEEISKANLDKWFLPSKKTYVLNSSGETTAATMYRGKTFIVFDKTMEWNGKTYTGLSDKEFSSRTLFTTLEGNKEKGLNFASLTEDNFKIINNVDKYYTNNMTISGVNTNDGNIFSRAFSKITLGDLKLTGETGISLLSKTHNFKISVNAKDSQKWIELNKDENNNIVFDSENIQKLYISDLDLTGVSAIVLRSETTAIKDDPNRLREFSLTDVTFPNCVIYSGTKNWADKTKGKYIDFVSFEKVKTNSLSLSNFTNAKIILNKVGPQDGYYASSFILLDTIGNETERKNIEIKGSLDFETIRIENSHFKDSLDFGENINTVNNLLIYSSSFETGLIAEGDKFKTVELTNVQAGTTTQKGAIQLGTAGLYTDPLRPRTINLSSVTCSNLILTANGTAVDYGFKKINISDIELRHSGSIDIDCGTAADLKINTITGPCLEVRIKNVNHLGNLVVSDILTTGDTRIYTIDNSNQNVTGSTWSILGSKSTGNVILELNGNPEKIILGASSENLLYLNDRDVTIPSSAKELYLKGVEKMNGNITAKKITTLEVGSLDGEKKNTINYLDFTNSNLETIRMYGSKALSVITTLEIESCENIKTIEAIGVDGTMEEKSGHKLAVVTLNAKNTEMPYTAFRNAISLVGGREGGNGGTLNTEGIAINDIGSELTIGDRSGTTTTRTETIEEVETVEEKYSAIVEVLAVEANEAAAKKVASTIHSPLCFDKIKQNAYRGGALSDCTTSCKTFTHGTETFHYHAADNIGIVFACDENGNTKTITERAEEIIPYRAGELETIFSDNTDSTYQRYKWGPDYVSIEHIGSEHRGSLHDENNLGDGCVIKYTYINTEGVETTEYFQRYGWDTINNQRLEVGTVSQDEGHISGKNAPINEEDTINSITVDGNKTMILRNMVLANLKNDYNEIKSNTKLREYGVTLSNGAPDRQKVETITKYSERTVYKDYTYTVSNSGNDRIEVLNINNMKNSQITKFNLSLANLKELYATTATDNNNNLQELSISSECKNLEKIDMGGYNKLSSFKIGSFNSKSSSWWANMDWMKWLPKLKYLNLSNCNVSFTDGHYWANGGGGTYEYKIRWGNSIETDSKLVTYTKKKGGGLGAQGTEGWVDFGGTRVLSASPTGGWSGETVTGDVKYTGTGVKGEGSINKAEWTGKLDGELVQMNIREASTSAYNHSYKIEVWPFGKK